MKQFRFRYSFHEFTIQTIVVIINIIIGFIYQISIGYITSLAYDYAKPIYSALSIIPVFLISLLGLLHTVNRLSYMYDIWKSVLWASIIIGIGLDYVWIYR